jgi:gamma-glutamyl-gamma-aminobutyrate hydrolase PuuD
VEEAQQALAEATQRVEFSGNTQDWVQALNDQADAQRNLNSIMAEGDAAFERAGEHSERYVNSLEGAMNSARENIVHLGEEIGSTTQKMKVQEAEAAQLGQQYDSLQADMDAMVTKSLAADSATIPEELMVTALTEDGEVMAVQHREYKIYGVQFHPESIMTPDGKKMLMNFIKEA